MATPTQVDDASLTELDAISDEVQIDLKSASIRNGASVTYRELRLRSNNRSKLRLLGTIGGLVKNFEGGGIPLIVDRHAEWEVSLHPWSALDLEAGGYKVTFEYYKQIQVLRALEEMMVYSNHHTRPYILESHLTTRENGAVKAYITDKTSIYKKGIRDGVDAILPGHLADLKFKLHRRTVERTKTLTYVAQRVVMEVESITVF